MPRGSPNWTAAERDAVRAWLDGPDDRVGDLDLPRVFVYPFPPAFADMRAVLGGPGRQKLTREQWCRAVGPIWRDHLRTFHDGATSYLRRNGRRDHFFVVGRAWHLAGDRKKKDQLRQLEQYGALEDCAYRWSGFRGAQRLVLESQYDFNRLCASVHPLPYQSFLPYASATSWGDAWFGAGDRRWLASGFFAVWDKDELTDPSGAREAFHDACDAWDACRLSLPAAGYYEAAYRNSTFALQPCGHSAVRKGIVDSLLAGAIPVLSSSEPRTHSYVSAKDQRDVWPWNWPSQGATSIILDVRELPRLAEILSRVDSEQVALMRRAISRVAAGLAWPLFPDAAVGDPDRRPNALDLAMHHLHVAVRASATDDAKGRCPGPRRRVAESLAATKSAVRWIDWWRRT
ncbi:hypothetical protein JL722_2067 [Aureococcus anophagefferens]|nr:hypothetical protein JL722_2067 [Aureococcus anophagefferens]